MNFAFSAIIVTLLLLPGAIGIKSYYTSLKTNESDFNLPITELVVKGLILTITAHCTAICILNCFNLYPKFNILYLIIAGKDLDVTDQNLNSWFLQFCSYSITLTFILWLLAKGIKRFVKNRNLDLNYYFLRNSNYWYTLFSARYLEADGIAGSLDETDFIFLDVYTNINTIYSGVLSDFNVNSKGDLECILLKNAHKRIINTHSDGEVISQKLADASSISGDFLLIPVSKIENINISYIKLNETAADETDVAIS